MALAGICAAAGVREPGEPVAGAGQCAATGDERAPGGGRGARAHGAADADREPDDFADGGGAGLALAYAVRNGIPRMLANWWLPPAFSARFDWRIFFFAAGISLVTGLIFGLAPAWAATRVR